MSSLIRRCCWLAALLFAVHPVHTEAVAGVVGRADVLAAVFFLGSVLAYARHVGARDGNEGAAAGRKRRRSPANEEKSAGEGRDKNGNVTTPLTLPPEGEKKWWEAKKRREGGGKLHRLWCGENSDEEERKWEEASVVVGGKSRGFVRASSSSSKWLCCSVILSGLAMFSKEQGVTALGVCFAADLLGCFGGTKVSSAAKKRNSLLLLALSASALLAVRARAMGFSPPSFAKADNPAAASSSFLTRFLTFAHLPALNAWLLLCPSSLSFDWSMDAVPLVERVWDIRNAATLVFYSILVKLGLSCTSFTRTLWMPVTLKKESKVISSPATALSLLLMCLPFLPASNLFFYVGFVVAERVLYIPSLGSCLLVAHLLDRRFSVKNSRCGSSRSSKRFWLSAAVLLLIPLAAKTVFRNRDWGDEGQLYLSGVGVNPPKGRVLYMRNHIEQVLYRTWKCFQAIYSPLSPYPHLPPSFLPVSATFSDMYCCNRAPLFSSSRVGFSILSTQVVSQLTLTNKCYKTLAAAIDPPSPVALSPHYV